jgi:hypothetical protein
MKKFIISEDEKSRILEMHVNATKNLYLKEQLQPTTAANVAAPSIKYSEVAGSASAVPIVDATVLTKLGIPATPDNFSNTFFWTNRQGLSTAFAEKNMRTFTGTTPRSTNSPDNVFAKYTDGSEISIEGKGTKEFPTKGLKAIGGAGNGLLALSRAISTSAGKLPSMIKITLSGERTGVAYTYNSSQINNTNAVFNALLAYFIKPLVNPQKVNPTYPFKDIVLGQPNRNGTIEDNINSLLGKFLPKTEGKRLSEVAAEYGLNMDANNFKQQILASSDLSNADAKWNEIQSSIVAKYRENLDKFLTAKFPDTKDQKLSAFNPKTSSESATRELKAVSRDFGPGISVPNTTPREKQTQQTFKSGEG